MRDLIVTENITLDGVIEATAGWFDPASGEDDASDVETALRKQREAADALKARPAAAPERRVFEVAAVVRSYYDPLILAAFFRWMKPDEAWWGFDDRLAETVVHELLGRAEPEERRVLVPEILLACAQGKVPAPGVVVARVFAQLMLERVAPEFTAHVRLGLALAPETDSRPSAKIGQRAADAGSNA